MDLKIQVLNVARFPKEDSIYKFTRLSSRKKEAWTLQASRWKKSSPGAMAPVLGIAYRLEVETRSPSVIRLSEGSCRNRQALRTLASTGKIRTYCRRSFSSLFPRGKEEQEELRAPRRADVNNTNTYTELIRCQAPS